MNKDTMQSKDDWEGALTSRFEEDMTLPPDKSWSHIQHELFPTNKRRFVALWISVSIILLGGLGFFLFQKSTISENEIKAKNETQSKEISTKNSGKNSTIKPQQKLVLTEKDEEFKIKNRETNVSNELNQLVSNQTKNSESTSSENRTADSKNTLGKSTKINISKKQNQISKSFEKSTSTTEISSKKNEQQASNHEKRDNEIVANNNLAVNSSENTEIPDSSIRLKLLPAHLLSATESIPIQEVAKKDKTDFKPFFSWQVSPLIGRNIRIVSGSFNSDNTYSNALGERRAPLPKYGFQNALNYHFNKRLSLNAGFQWAGGDFQSRWFFKYLQIDPATNDVRLKTTSGEASTTDPTLIQSITNGTSGIYKLRINHAFSLYSIPIGITYHFTDRRFSPYFRTGLNLEFFGRRSLSLDVLENGMARNIELNLKRPNNRLNLQAMAALGIERRINNNWIFFTEAGYYVPLNQFVNANGYSVRMAGSSILGGVRYDLKK